MKVLYVSDNRARGNYGCRATSTALSQLIRQEHEIVGVISGRYTNHNTNNLFFCKYFPSWLYKVVGKWKNNSKHRLIIEQLLFGIIRRISKMLSKHYYAGPCDFVSLNFEQSIKNLKKCLPANPYLEEFNLDNYEFDAMVVNGEGSFIFATPEWNWREALVLSMLMYWALKKGKKVYFLNAMFSDESTSPRNQIMLGIINKLLKQCEVVQVREDISYQYAINNLPDSHPVVYPDALFTWYPVINDEHIVTDGKYYIPHVVENDLLYESLDFKSPYICIAGSSSVKTKFNPLQTITSYSKLVTRLKEKFSGNIFLVEVCEGDAFLNEVSKQTNTPIISIETPILAAAKILANARAFISGRYHPAIMASMGGTPCVFMGSNSHKTSSLQGGVLQYSNIYEFCEVPTDEDMNQMIELTLAYIEQGERLRNKIKTRASHLCEEAQKIKTLIK